MKKATGKIQDSSNCFSLIFLIIGLIVGLILQNANVFSSKYVAIGLSTMLFLIIGNFLDMLCSKQSTNKEAKQQKKESGDE
jgi:F0F1-type ATP synthase assembly protein I